jgi:hypothetical protein
LVGTRHVISLERYRPEWNDRALAANAVGVVGVRPHDRHVQFLSLANVLRGRLIVNSA